jgi:hypothetical protein
VCQSQALVVTIARQIGTEYPRRMVDWDKGLWRYRAALPGVEPLSLGEGCTPLLASRCLPGVWWKEEGANPTGSVQARGAAVAVAVARAAGAHVVRWEGSAEAQAAVAAYAAAAGCSVAAGAPEGAAADRLWLSLLTGKGGQPLDEAAWDAGVGTVALEIAEQLGGQLPRTVVWVGAGARGLKALQAGCERSVQLCLAAGALPVCLAPEPQPLAGDDELDLLREVLRTDGVVLSRAGAQGALAATERPAVVINPRSALREAEELARLLGLRALPGRVPVGGIIAPA